MRIKSNLGKRIVIILSVLLFISTLLVTGISYHHSADVIRREILASSRDMLTITGKNLEDYLEKVSSFSLTPLVDAEWTNAMYQEPDHFEQIVIENKLKNMALSRDDISSLRYYNALSHETFLLDVDHKKVSIVNDKVISQSDAFQMAVHASGYDYIETLVPASVLSTRDTVDETIFIYHRIFINIQTREPVGMLTIGINGRHWFDSVLYALSPNGEDIALFTSDGKLVCANSLRGLWLKEDQLSEDSLKLDGESFIKIMDNTPDGDFALVKLIPERYISEQLTQLQITIFSWSIFISILIIILVYLIVTRLTRPLKRLANHMENAVGTELVFFAGEEGQDEVGLLTRRFNEMADNMNHLVNREYKARISEQEAHLKALEAQLNPHFLSNALQAISTTVLQNDLIRSNKMLVALGHLIDFSFRGASMVIVWEELQYVNYYFTLIQGRFDDRFSHKVIVDDECFKRVIPKFTIQGLAENVVKHVLEKSTQQVCIEVQVKAQGSRLVIEVKDNGSGISPEVLNTLFTKSETDKLPNHAVGLRNLKARLDIVYGTRASFEIISGTDGTHIMIAIDGEEDEVEFIDAG